MIKFYGTKFSSRLNKLLFLANALGLEHQLEILNMMEGEHQQPENLKRHPAGKIPSMDDDGFILFESNAILRYLTTKKDNSFYPEDPKTRAIIDQWIDFASQHVDTAFGRVLFNRIFGPNMPGYEIDTRSLEDGLKFLDRFLPILEEQLKKNEYIAGDKMTLADFNLLAILDPAEVAEVDLTSYKKLSEWRSKLKKEDFYQKVFTDYTEALKAMA